MKSMIVQNLAGRMMCNGREAHQGTSAADNQQRIQEVGRYHRVFKKMLESHQRKSALRVVRHIITGPTGNNKACMLALEMLETITEGGDGGAI